MNHPLQPPPEDPESLLRSGLRDTTPEFERRWVDLRRALRQGAAPRTAGRRRWWWSLLPAAVAVTAVWLLLLPPAPREPAADLGAYAELFSLDADLRAALPLTDLEAVDTLFNLSLPDPS